MKESVLSRRADPHDVSALFLRALCAAGIGLAVAAASLLVGCAAAFRSPDPAALVLPLSIAAFYLSATACGIAAGYKSDAPLVHGMTAGIVYCLLTALLSLLPFGQESGLATLHSLLLRSASVPVAMLAAGIGHRRTHRPGNRRKKRLR
jgi:hypothetical protein